MITNCQLLLAFICLGRQWNHCQGLVSGWLQPLLWLYTLILDRQALLQLLGLLVLMLLSAACALSPLLTHLSTCLKRKPPVTSSRVVLQDPHLGCVKLTPFILNRKKSLTTKHSAAQHTTSWLKIQSSRFFLLLLLNGILLAFSRCSCLVELLTYSISASEPCLTNTPFIRATTSLLRPYSFNPLNH